MQDDLPERPQEGENRKPTSPLRSLQKKRKNWLATAATIALYAAGYDDHELIGQCSRGERNSAIVRGLLVILNTGWLAISFAVIGHYLLHSSFSPEIVLGAIFLAAFLGLVDHYVMLRTAIFPDGMKGLRHGGFGVDVPIGAGFSSKFCKTLRIMLSLAVGGVVALFLGLVLNDAAVNRRIIMQHLAENKILVQRAVKDFEERRLRTAKAYGGALAAVNTLSAEVARLVKQSNRKSSSRTADRVSENETRLVPAQAALDESKRELDTIDAGRPEEIETAIARSPDYIPVNDALIARIKALFAEIHDDPWVAMPLAVFDAIVVGIDVVISTLKAIAMPSTYCMQDTRRHLSAMVQQARGARVETETVERSPGLAPEGNDDDPPDEPAAGGQPSSMPKPNGGTPAPPPPPRRGRGRPRKPRLN
jgi:hypothetical protein